MILKFLFIYSIIIIRQYMANRQREHGRPIGRPRTFSRGGRNFPRGVGAGQNILLAKKTHQKETIFLMRCQKNILFDLRLRTHMCENERDNSFINF